MTPNDLARLPSCKYSKCAICHAKTLEEITTPKCLLCQLRLLTQSLTLGNSNTAMFAAMILEQIMTQAGLLDAK